MVNRALLFSVDDHSVDLDLLLKLRNKMESDPNLEVLDLDDIEHVKFDEKQSYAEKLKRMLTTRINRVFLINSPELRRLVEENHFGINNTNLNDPETQDIISQFLSSECGKPKSKLVLLSLKNEKEEISKNLKDIEHVCMVDGNGQIDNSKVNTVIGMSRLGTEPAVKTVEKEKGCVVT